MSGICGIFEARARLESAELEPMLHGLDFEDTGRTAIRASHGGLFGASAPSAFQNVGCWQGILVAVSADLCNLSDLVAEAGAGNGLGEDSLPELIAILYQQYGLAFLEKLDGGFSLALWDPAENQLVLAVDRLGLDTLFWSKEGDQLTFGSRLGAVTAAKMERSIDPAALVQFLIHTVVPAPLTIYRGIERLEPGTMLLERRGQLVKQRYWDLKYDENAEGTTAHWAEKLREDMRRAVHSQLRDLRPAETGGYLSGGTDSSSVLAFASELFGDFNTFSIYFENPRYDEAGFARKAAQVFHANHHERCLVAGDAAQAIPKITEYFEEPFANSSAVGAYHCARLAREHGVDVLLAGDGGDELFAGNERYSSDKKFELYHRIPSWLRTGLIKPLASAMPTDGTLSLPSRYIRRAELPNPQRIFSYSFFLSQMVEDVFEGDLLEQAPQSTWMEIPTSHFKRAPNASSELNRLLYLDAKMTLADNDVRKVKGTAEMAGVKVRFPLMDHRLAEFSASVPSRLKLKGFEKRFIFKQAMKGILPDSILYKKKHGFGVPVGYWMLHDKEMQSIAAVLDEPRTHQRGYFRPEFLRRIRKLNESDPAYYGEVVWLLLMLELWHREHFDHSPARAEKVSAYHVS